MENDTFWSEIGLGYEEPSGTSRELLVGPTKNSPLGSHSRKLNKYMEIKALFPLFQQNIITRPVANNSYMCRQERRMKRYISTSEITLKKFIVEN